jgi:hypothetical protein
MYQVWMLQGAHMSADGVRSKDSGRVILSKAADDWVIRGGDLEEVARLEALEAALRPGGDTVVVLNSATDEEILRLIDHSEGQLGEGGEGDKLVIIVSRPKVWTRRSAGDRMITSLDVGSYARRRTVAATRIEKKVRIRLL